MRSLTSAHAPTRLKIFHPIDTRTFSTQSVKTRHRDRSRHVRFATNSDRKSGHRSRKFMYSPCALERVSAAVLCAARRLERIGVAEDAGRWPSRPKRPEKPELLNSRVALVPSVFGLCSRRCLCLPSLPVARGASVRREAIEQPAAAGRTKVGLTAASVRTTRGMARVPRACARVAREAHAVVMADHGCSLGAAGPVDAGAVLSGREVSVVRFNWTSGGLI
jgi:hypothetical protein